MSSSLTRRLEAKIERWLLDEMSAAKFPELKEQDLKDLLITYGNWRTRFVAQRPRTVNLSAELKSELGGDERSGAIDLIAEKIRSAADLTPHLSRDVRFVLDDGKGQRQRDLDPMLAEWGLHHLHLGTELEEDGFVDRSKNLLFVGFTATDAYLVGLYPHGGWALKDVVERLARNWDGAGIILPCEYAIGVTQTFDDEELAALRNAGITILFEVDGRVYTPRGQTLGGTPLRVTQEVNGLCWSLDDWKGRESKRLPVAVEGRLAYWLPAIRNGSCGFSCGEEFVTLGALPRARGGE